MAPADRDERVPERRQPPEALAARGDTPAAPPAAQRLARIVLATVVIAAGAWILYGFLPALAWAGVLAIALSRQLVFTRRLQEQLAQERKRQIIFVTRHHIGSVKDVSRWPDHEQCGLTLGKDRTFSRCQEHIKKHRVSEHKVIGCKISAQLYAIDVVQTKVILHPQAVEQTYISRE